MTSKTQKPDKHSSKNQSKWIYALLLGLFIGMFYGRNLSGDVWWHLKTGQWIVQHHSLPSIDPFSYTARNPIILHEWGSEVIEWLAYSISPSALAALSVMLISGAFLLAFRTALARSKSVLASFMVVAAGASASAAAAEMRPQVFSFVLLALTVIILQRYHEKGGKIIWLLPPLMLLWVNLHAIFLIGIALIGFEAVIALIAPPKWVNEAKSTRFAAVLPLVGVLFASVLLTLINPNGITPYVYPFKVMSHSAAMALTNEWTPPSFDEWTGRSLLVLLGLAVVGLISVQRPTLRDFAYVAIFAAAALRSQRHEVIFSIVAAGPIALWLSHAIRQCENWFTKRYLDIIAGRLVWGILAVLVGVLFVWRVSDAQGKTAFDYMNTSEMFPTKACDFVEVLPVSGPMYNDYNYGGYLIWRLWPEHKVFVDSRQEPFLNGTFEEEREATNYPEKGTWQKTFAKYKINFAVLNPYSPLAHVLMDRSDWVCVFADDTGIVFIRDIPENAAAIQAAGAR